MSIYSTNLGINVGGGEGWLTHLRFLVVVTCADIYNGCTILGCGQLKHRI